ncbi:NAD(P)-dependent oxidoreductase [Acidiplasma sp.]|uniref:NAD(P)-dependent oxidoreductase n=1 Tax=Acidiplasma sp. TaxID=1872114 RepID=UPI00258625C3|nr:NAD(P)-dependent oxidoreductase [Acidiplasma sp.]
MKTLVILPAFLPVEDIKKTVNQIMPGIEIRTDMDFEKDDAEVVVITTFTQFGKNEIDKFPNLKFLQVSSTGYNNVDVKYLKSRNIILSNIPRANKDAVAEHVLAMVLAFLKNLIFFDKEIRSGNWPILTDSTELNGKIFGIIGMGAIGIKLVQRLIPFGPGIIYYDVKRLPAEDEELYGLIYMELDDVIRSSDILSIHLPLTEGTLNLFDDKHFSMMKDNAIFINTSRGEIMDENALVKAIKTKNIFAGIDVYSKEPPDFSSELFKLDNVIFSPHIAGVTIESQQRFLQETIGNLIKYTQGLEPLYQIKGEHQ